MILRKIIRIIQVTTRGLWLTLGISWPASSSSIEQKQPDADEPSASGEITVTNNFSDKALQGNLSKSSPRRQKTALGEFLGNDFCAEDDQDGALSDAPAEQLSLGKGESFESGKCSGRRYERLGHQTIRISRIALSRIRADSS